MLAREKRVHGHAGFRRQLAEAAAFELVRDEHEALLLGELLEGGIERFGLHQALCLDELEEDVLQHILHVLAVGHVLPDEVAQPATLALDRLGDSPVLLAHRLLEDQDCPPVIDVDGGEGRIL